MTRKSLYHASRPRGFAIPREVIKRVGARAYRYRVESYRDGAKVRARWTYLGVAEPSESAVSSIEAVPQPRNAAAITRARLIDAFERLAEHGAYATLTAGAVASEAGLAHGTFYRYFSNKRGVLVAALERVREAFERVRPSFSPPYGDLASERARVRAWTSALGTMPAARGVVRAWYDALDGDLELEAVRAVRFGERIAYLTLYLGALADAGTIAVAEPEALATALTTLVDAVFRATIVSGTAANEALLVGVTDVFDRAIFQGGR